MAQKRMFNRAVTESDTFLELSPEAQALYFHLCMAADDDGFIGSRKAIERMVGVGEEAYQALIQAGLLIQFPSGTSLVRHWNLHNRVAADRYHPTLFREEWSQVTAQDGVYRLNIEPQGA